MQSKQSEAKRAPKAMQSKQAKRCEASTQGDAKQASKQTIKVLSVLDGQYVKFLAKGT